MTTLVTGATGFIGRNFVRTLYSQCKEVIALVRGTSVVTELEDYGIPYIRGDLDNYEGLLRLLAGVDTVVHIGGPGLTDILSGKESAGENISTLVRACATCEIKRLVYLSTIKAGRPSLSRGSSASLVNDEMLADVYARKKRREEEILIAEGINLPWLIIRAPAVYGPLDKKSWPIFKITQNKIVPRLPNGYCSKFSMIHVEDLVGALLLSIQEQAPLRKIIEVGNDEPITWNEIVDILSPKTRIKVEIPYRALAVIVKLLKWVDIRKWRSLSSAIDRWNDLTLYDWVADTTTAMSQLKFRAKIPLQVGLINSLTIYQQNGWK